MGIVTKHADDRNMHYITKYGFNPVMSSITRHFKSDCYESGYVLNHESLAWISVSYIEKKVFIFIDNETDGNIGNAEFDIPDIIDMSDENDFIPWFDEEVTKAIAPYV
jgi:hypothetical protein